MADQFTEIWADALMGKHAPAKKTKPQMPRRPPYEYPAPECTAERFLQDVANHQMKILRDDGLYRHLNFQRADNIFNWFEIV